MSRTLYASALIAALSVALSAGQTGKPPSVKSIVHDVTIKTVEGETYTGIMEMAVVKTKVSGTLHLTKPTEIKGAVAGTAEKGVVKLEFPYHMTERKCNGTVRMQLTLPAKLAPATGSMEAVGCGRDETRKLTGTVELVPRK